MTSERTPGTERQAIVFSSLPRSEQRAGARISSLPNEVLSLAKREREIAGIVYNKGKATANDVLACVSAPLSNAAIRSMLNRLVAKGILFRRRAVAGKQFIYVPAISNSISLERAFQQIAEDYFDGSMDEAFSALTSILIRRADSLAEAQQRRCS